MFQLHYAVGMVLLGGLVGFFQTRRLYIYAGLTLVGFITTFDVFWGIITFLELLIGYRIGQAGRRAMSRRQTAYEWGSEPRVESPPLKQDASPACGEPGKPILPEQVPSRSSPSESFPQNSEATRRKTFPVGWILFFSLLSLLIGLGLGRLWTVAGYEPPVPSDNSSSARFSAQTVEPLYNPDTEQVTAAKRSTSDTSSAVESPQAKNDPTFRPSFDCGASPLSIAEATICATSDLIGLDRALGRAWQALAPHTLEQLDQQRAWLVQRDACVSETLCLRRIYLDRLSSLRDEGQTELPSSESLEAASGAAPGEPDWTIDCHSVSWRYPPRARELAKQGECAVRFDLNADGRAHNINADCSDKVFQSSAERAVRQTRFVPYTLEGQARKADGLTCSVRYELE